MSATIGDAVALLSRVAAILAQRHRVTIADRCLYVAGARVAGVTGQEGADGVRLFVRPAVVGPNADIPKGLGRVTFIPGRRTATPEHIADAIQARLDAEAANPVPVACPSRSREAAPALPAMPQPARVAASSVRHYSPGFAGYGMPVSGVGTLRPSEPRFTVRRHDVDTGETGEVDVWADELTPDEIAAMAPTDRELAERWKDISDERDAECVHNAEAAAAAE